MITDEEIENELKRLKVVSDDFWRNGEIDHRFDMSQEEFDALIWRPDRPFGKKTKPKEEE
jgi:hypothetical protein